MAWRSFVLVDDSLFMRRLLRQIIEEIEDCVVVGEGSNGYDAISQARMSRPDVMLIDTLMPIKNGSEVVEEVLKVSPETQIIMVATLGQQAMIADAIRQGAKDFLTKPFKKEKIIKIIENLLLNKKDREGKQTI